MQTLGKVARATVPLYVAVFSLLGIGGFAVVAVREFSQTVNNYTLLLPKEPAATETQFQFGSWPALADVDFFNQVREKFLAQNATFIEANLSAMRLRLYENGTTTLDVPILTKGKEGSWWETPAGLYKVEGKIKNHFSGFAGVYLPWSLPFQGNFFIHGWPYYPAGAPVQSTYSGGCIRLSTADAKALFDRVSTGTPVLVYEEDFARDVVAYTPVTPQLTATHFLAADLKSSFVFAESSSSEAIPIASLTKLMTALVAVEYVNIEKTITIQNAMLIKTSKPRLKEGKTYSLYQLLFPLLLESSNEAAEAIAGFLGPKRFIALMNEKAKAIGMEQTRFADLSGIGGENTSTAKDLFELARYAYNNRSFILRVSAGKLTRSAYGTPAFQDLGNYNVFSSDPDFVGGKVGKSSAARETLLAVFAFKKGSDTRPIVFVVLDSENSAEDASTLVSWVRKTYF